MWIHDAVCVSLYSCSLAGALSSPHPLPQSGLGPSVRGPQTAGKQQGETGLPCYFVLQFIKF